MAAYIARDNSGWHYLPDDGLSAHQLDNESLRGPCHWWEAYPIAAITTKAGGRMATAGQYRVKAYREGGASAEQFVEGIGWVIDDEMPEIVFDALLAACKGKEVTA